jgi:hypothetical protein
MTDAARREAKRRWRANRERLREYDREKAGRWRAANRERSNAIARGSRGRRRHGVTDVASLIATLWEEQGGKCYLCGIYLVPWRVVLDHGHGCCGPTRTCARCRRGLACDYCNKIVGFAHDDPEVLRLIADNLAARIAELGQVIPDGAR